MWADGFLQRVEPLGDGAVVVGLDQQVCAVRDLQLEAAKKSRQKSKLIEI